MIEIYSDSFSAFQLDTLSLTDCPVHYLSMASPEWPNQWVEMAWAARDTAQRGMNEVRRGWFEGVKCLLLERDLPPTKLSGRTFVQALV